MRIPPFPRNLIPWTGFIATVIQIGIHLGGGPLDLGLLTFTGGLALTTIVAGGGEKG